MSVMNTHAEVALEQASEEGQRETDLHDRPFASKRPTLSERLGEVLPLIFFVPVAGPPAVLLVGPLLLLVLLLIPPTALILTLVLVLAVTVALLAVFAAVIASPFLLIRQLHNYNRKARHEDRRYRRHRPHWVQARHQAR